MPPHDAYARYTPYELAFPGRDFVREQGSLIAEEAESRGMDTSDPDSFVMVGAVGRALREIQGPEDDPSLIRQHGLLLFHGYHLHRAGEPLWLLDLHTTRYLVESEPGPGEGDWELSLPGPAGYVQLPQHLFWAEPVESRPPESADGFFWSAPGGEDLHLLLVLGVRGDRPGMSVAPVPPVPAARAGSWLRGSGREEGPDFRSDLPGAELERLYAFETPAEILKLAVRAFWYLEACPEAVREREGKGVWGREPEAESRGDGGPRPSSLAYRKVGLEEARTGGEEEG